MPRNYKRDSSNQNSVPQTPSESDEIKSNSYHQSSPINNTNYKTKSNF